MLTAEEKKSSENMLNTQALFAGGCFWCMESRFAKLEGITSITVGYSGGSHLYPTYKLVSSGVTGHTEAMFIKFDPKQISYIDLLNFFWRQIDPTDTGGQFVDRGDQYRSEIFYFTDDQRRWAQTSKRNLQGSGPFLDPIVTPISKAEIFYAAEDYHQAYHKKNPLRYKYFSYRSGREQFLKKVWNQVPTFPEPAANLAVTDTPFVRPSLDKIQFRLSELQFDVTQKDATEPAFKNSYWDNKEAGIYVDVVSGEPLFSSTHKYDSGTGWPSFWQVLKTKHIETKEDNKLFRKRTEVRSKIGQSHLGHVFNDGPKPTNLRYCINSASLKFIAVNDLASQGYEEFLALFEKQELGEATTPITTSKEQELDQP